MKLPLCSILVSRLLMTIPAPAIVVVNLLQTVGASRIQTSALVGRFGLQELESNSSNVTLDLLPLDIIGTPFGMSTASMVETSVSARSSHWGGEILGGILQAITSSRPTNVFFIVFGFFLVAICIGTCCATLSHNRHQRKRPQGRNQYIVRDRILYEWDQTPKTITIYTRPPGKMSQENIEVIIGEQHVHIGRKGKTPFLKEPLFAAVKVDDCSWCISRKGELEICLHKVEDGEWPCVISGKESAKTPVENSSSAESAPDSRN